jgi:PTS system mannose-specific IIB component
MVNVIVAAHGELARSLVGSSEMILGKVPGVAAVTFLPGQGPEDLLSDYDRMSRADEATILLVDLFGGSPYNAAVLWALAHEGSDVVTGVNLPMLIEVLTQARRGRHVDALVTSAQSAGSAGIRSFRANYRPPTTAADDEGDELL